MPKRIRACSLAADTRTETQCSPLTAPWLLEAKSERMGMRSLLADLEIALGMVRDKCQVRPE
jgi:hypothetical protein